MQEFRNPVAQRRSEIVGKIIQLLENEEVTMTEANAISDLLSYRLKKNSALIGNTQKFTVYKD